MNTSRPTLLDVARAAGVSRTTASAALGGQGRISEGTRERIRSTARAIGYTGNVAARNLRRGRAGVIALHLPGNVGSLEYYMQFVFGAADAARAAGYALTILASGRGVPLDLDSVDGIIVVDPLSDDETIDDILQADLPTVSSERMLQHPTADVIVVEPDHGRSIGKLLDHMADAGSERIALIGAGTDSAWGARTANAYSEWCRSRGRDAVLRQTSFTATASEVGAVAAALLDDSDAPDAIVSCPDGAALGVIDAARDRGLQVGRDLLLGATVDSTPFRYVTPAVTALDHRAHALGQHCAELLIDWVRSGERVQAPEHPELELRIRATTDPSYGEDHSRGADSSRPSGTPEGVR